MKLAITGSTGYVGRELVSLLEKEAIDLVLLGRDVDRLKEIFPGKTCNDYSSLPECLVGVDAIIHLAVLNNDAASDVSEFNKINVNFAMDIAQKSSEAGVKTFVNFCSFHELDDKNLSSYANSKRDFSKIIDNFNSMNIVKIYAPYIFGSKFRGSLYILNKSPKFLSNIIFYFCKSLRPSVNIIKISDFILTIKKIKGNKRILLYDNIESNKVYKFFKRFIEISFSISIILLFFWLFIIIWCAIQLESGRPGIFSQDRVGRDGKIFRCHKFRTMRQATAQLGTHEVPASAVTKLGKVLRSTKLDELPQIWNILRNELSLVGPRPCLPGQYEVLAERTKRNVLSIKPGITGLAQIHDVDMSNPILLADWDERYVASRSLLLDIKIILSTLLGSGKGDRVKTD